MSLHQFAFRSLISVLADLYSRSSDALGFVLPSLEAFFVKEESSSPTQTVAFDPYKSSSFVGHSLWMVPSGDALEAYGSIIGKTANELGTFHFLPHITLVAALMESEEDVVKKTRELASQLAPYEFVLDDISQKDAYFQCLYATMKKTDDVIHANQVARQVFEEKQKDPAYMPHLSLVYGNFTFAEKENIIMPKLRQELQSFSPKTYTIPVDAIEVWSTEGDVKEWYLVERLPLTGKR